MTVLDWVIIGVIAIIAITFIVYNVVKLCKMDETERKRLLVTYLIGLCDFAEIEIIGTSVGKERIAWVEEQFKEHAGWFLKAVLLFTKTANLQDLIETALRTAKETEWDKKN